MEPAGPSPPVAVVMSPPSNIVSRGVLMVIAPALPVPCVRAEIRVGLFTTVTPWKLDDCPVCPEIDSSSDAVTDTVPPGPEAKVVLLIEAPPVRHGEATGIDLNISDRSRSQARGLNLSSFDLHTSGHTG